MKFEKFVKLVGSRGIVLTSEKFGKFLQSGMVMVRIPEGANVVAAIARKMPEWYEEILNDVEDDCTYKAELTGAELPTPDASPTQILRIFTDSCGGRVAIDNKTFAIIEKSDKVFICPDTYEDGDGKRAAALAVCYGFGDDAEIAGIVFSENYFRKMNEKENA